MWHIQEATNSNKKRFYSKSNLNYSFKINVHKYAFMNILKWKGKPFFSRKTNILRRSHNKYHFDTYKVIFILLLNILWHYWIHLVTIYGLSTY